MCMDTRNSYVDRHHRGHRTVAICYMSDRKIYSVMVWPRLENDPFRPGHIHLEYETYAEACAVGDNLAHPICDGTCAPWGPDPQVERNHIAGGERCPACGCGMRLVRVSDDDGPPRSIQELKKQMAWICENRDCASFDPERPALPASASWRPRKSATRARSSD